MSAPQNTGMGRILAATRCSAQGFGHAWKYESGRAQDPGSAAVFVSLVLVAAVWLTIGRERFLG